MALTLDLTTPLITHDGPITALPLQRPTLAHLAASGAPFTVTQTLHEDGSMSVATAWHFPVVAALLAAMSGLDELVLAEIDGRDVLTFCDKLFAMLRGEL